MAAFLVVFALVGACARDVRVAQEPTPSPTPTPNAMPLPGTSATPEAVRPVQPSNVEKPFTVTIHNCYLVDPDINPVGAPQSREKGIRMVVSGAIRNNTDKLIFRAGVFSKLVVNFGTDVSFEKHSPGLGFEPAVTSTDPWRPGSWRSFRIEGRAFDPIYREFAPKTITGILSLEARDPIDFRVSEELERMRPRWGTLFGIPVDISTTLAEDVSISVGPHAQKRSLKAGAALELVAQQGGGYLALSNKHYFGWIPEKSLTIRQYETMYPDAPPATLPLTATIDGRYEVRLEEYRYDAQAPGLPPAPGGYMDFSVSVTSLAQSQSLTVRPEYFWVDQGSGRLSEGTTKGGTEPGALPAQTMLKPGETIKGWVYMPRHKDGWPFALVFDPPGSPSGAHVIVLSAIARNGG